MEQLSLRSPQGESTQVRPVLGVMLLLIILVVPVLVGGMEMVHRVGHSFAKA